jgi:hypothetical protein
LPWKHFPITQALQHFALGGFPRPRSEIMKETFLDNPIQRLAVATFTDAAGAWVLAIMIAWIVVTLIIATVVIVIARLALSRACVQDVPTVVAELRGYLPGIATWLLPVTRRSERSEPTPPVQVEENRIGEPAEAPGASEVRSS